MSPHITVVTSSDGIADLRQEWLEIRARAGLPTPNADPERFEATVRAMGAAVAPHLVLFRDATGPGALIVARRTRCGVPCRIGYWTFFTPAVDCLEVVYGGLITLPTAAWRASVADYLVSLLSRREVAHLFVNQLPVDDPLYATLTNHSVFARRMGPPHAGVVRRQRLVPGSYAETMAHHAGRTMRTWRKKHKRLTEDCAGQLDIVLLDKVNEIDRLFLDVCAVAERTYQTGLGAAFADTPLWRAIVRAELERGCFRAYIMYAQSRPIAFALGTVVADALVLDAIGYLPEHAQRSPGLLLLLHVTEQACLEGLAWVDHGFGESEHKRILCTDTVNTASLRFYAPGVAALFARTCEYTAACISHAGVRALERMGWVARVRKSWRARLSTSSDQE